MSSQGISQKEYLKKYLSRGGDDKKKKKRKPLKTGANRLRIVDDDVDVKNMRPIDDDELELYNLEEDAPQIAGIIDERPEEIKIREKFGTKKWKVVAAENDVGLQIIDKSNIKSEPADRDVDNDLSPVRRKAEASGSKDRDNVSPPRKPTDYSTCSFAEMLKHKPTRGNDKGASPQQSSKSSGQKFRKSSDSDASPPRRTKRYESDISPKRKRKDDSDASPPRRKNRYDSDESPPRQKRRQNFDSRRRKGSDSDASPPRRRKGQYSVVSPPRQNRRKDDAGSSPPRRNRKADDSDTSPPRRHHRRHNTHESPPRKSRNHHTVDKVFIKKEKEWDDAPDNSRKERSKENISRKVDRKYDSDESPARRNEKESNKSSRRTEESPVRRKDRESPPRRRDADSDDKRSRRKYDSPPRRIPQRNMDESHTRHDKKYETQGSKEKNYETGESSKFHKKDHQNGYEAKGSRDSDKSKTTLDGRKAGLVEAGQLRAEIEELHTREKEIFAKMDADISGKGAAPVMRDRKTGKKRDFEQEAKEQKEKEERKAERDSKYSRWGKGMKQVQDHEQRLQNELYEMTKPLARYADDKDLDKMLRSQEREGDPMLEYIRSKAKDQGSEKAKQKYEGSFMPNRFGIRPGFRWDGVDRSNGYEKQWFETQNARKATEEEAYKWSTADM